MNDELRCEAILICPKDGGTGTTAPFDADEQGFSLYDAVDDDLTQVFRFERVLP